MFIRSKIVKGNTYYQVAESYRDDAGKVQQRNVVSLGQNATVDAAIKGAKRMIRLYENQRDDERRKWPDWRPKHSTARLQRAEHSLTRHTDRLALLKSIKGKVSTRPSG